MLINIPPLLGPDLLHALRAMGHGDEIAIVDANFPALARARRLIRLDGITATATLEAILAVLPLDDFVPCPAHRMAVVNDPEAVPDICMRFEEIVYRDSAYAEPLGKIERFAFYQRVERCFAVIATGETRLYGNIILTKGIIRPETDDGD